MQSTLLSDIEAFIAEHGIAESTFGRDALGDWRLIAELRGDGGRKPRRLWPETEVKIRRFMEAYAAENEVGHSGEDAVAAPDAPTGKPGEMSAAAPAGGMTGEAA